MNTTRPDWTVAILDGQPEVMINLPAIAEMVRHAPIGCAEGIARLRATGSFTPAQIAEIESLVGGAA